MDDTIKFVPELKDVRPERVISGRRAARNEGFIPSGSETLKLDPDRTVRLGGGGGLIGISGEPLASLTWDKYIAWRRTKCRPYDYANGPALATKPPGENDERVTDINRDRGLEEIDQAILELIGEVAELGELIITNAPTVWWDKARAKLIDECGDILFCSMWALDAWGTNPFVGEPTIDLSTQETPIATNLGNVLARAGMIQGIQDKELMQVIDYLCSHIMVDMMTCSGLLANSFKKLRYQRREQDVAIQVGRIVKTMIFTGQILAIANSTPLDAMQVNMKKLDARFPDGYQPGVGGGIRTGEGR